MDNTTKILMCLFLLIGIIIIGSIGMTDGLFENVRGSHNLVGRAVMENFPEDLDGPVERPKPLPIAIDGPVDRCDCPPINCVRTPCPQPYCNIEGECVTPTCGNRICEPGEENDCPTCNQEDRWCSRRPCIMGTCPEDCVVCNDDDICDPEENTTNCPTDCWCGNNKCDNGEDETNCPQDCKEQPINDWVQTSGPQGGKFLKVEVDAADGNIIYTGAYPITDFRDDGGFIKSNDAGNSWKRVEKGLSSDTEIWAVDAHDKISGLVFAGSNEGYVYRSDNFGESWEQIKDANCVEECFETIFSILTHPEDKNIILAGTRFGFIYRTADGGKTWTTIDERKGLDTDGVISSIHYNPHNPNVLIATSGFIDVWDRESRHGIFKSNDKGETWYSVSSGLQGKLHFGDAAFDPLNPNIVWAVNGLIGEEHSCIFKSEDGGETWEMNLCGGADGYGDGYSTIEYDPHNPTTIYAGGTSMEIVKSTDNGETWEQINNGILTEENAGSFITNLKLNHHKPGYVYVSTYAAGLYGSRDGGNSWIELNDDTVIFSYTRAVSANPGHAKEMYASSFTNGVHKTSDGQNWKRVLTDGFSINGAVDLIFAPSNPQVILSIGGEVEKDARISRDGGINWDVVQINAPTAYTATKARDPTRLEKTVNGEPVLSQGEQQVILDHMQIKHFAIHPSNEDIIFAGTNGFGIYKSEDQTNSWQPVNGLPNDASVTWLTYHKDRIYASLSKPRGGIYVSENSGNSWNLVNDEFSFTTIHALAVDPTNDEVIYAAPWGGGLYKTTNGGNTWRQIGTTTIEENKPFSVSAIYVDPNNPNNIYATDRARAAFFFSNDGGKSWDFAWSTPDAFRLNVMVPDPSDSSAVFFTTFDIVRGDIKGDIIRWDYDSDHEFITGPFRAPLALAINPGNTNEMFVGAHIHGLYRTTNFGETWNDLGFPGTIVDLKIHQGTLYAASSCGSLPPGMLPPDVPPLTAECGVYRFSDDYSTWENLVPKNLREKVPKQMAIKDDMLFVATLDGGYVIELTGSPAVDDFDVPFSELGAIAVSQQNNKVFLGTHGAGIYAVTQGSDGFIGPKAEIFRSQIVSDGENLYVTSYPGGVFKSKDDGVTWTENNFALPSFRVGAPTAQGYYDLAINPRNKAHLLLGLFGKGIYESQDGAGTWSRRNQGLNNLYIYNVAFNTEGSAAFVGTNGLSVWRLDFNDQRCVCTQEYSPVCGVDGRTYPNECSANCEAAVACEGSCPCQPEVTEVGLLKDFIGRCEEPPGDWYVGVALEITGMLFGRLASCVDFDGGIEKFIGGKTILKDDDGLVIKYDTCIYGFRISSLTEWYCDGVVLKSERLSCGAKEDCVTEDGMGRCLGGEVEAPVVEEPEVDFRELVLAYVKSPYCKNPSPCADCDEPFKEQITSYIDENCEENTGFWTGLSDRFRKWVNKPRRKMGSGKAYKYFKSNC